MWIMKNKKLVSKESELCKGIDHARHPDHDLELDSKHRQHFDEDEEEVFDYFGTDEGEDNDEEGEVGGATVDSQITFE